MNRGETPPILQNQLININIYIYIIVLYTWYKLCGLLYDGLMIQYPVHDICWYLARTSERTRADIELLEFGQTDRRARVSGWDLLADSKRGSDPKVCVILAPLVQVTVTDVFHSFRLNHSSSTRDLTCCRYQVPFPVVYFLFFLFAAVLAILGCRLQP